MEAVSSIISSMNNLITKFIGFIYFRERIFVTIGLIISIINPIIGFGLVAIVFYNHVKSKRYGQVGLRKDDYLFTIVSLVLLGIVSILNIIVLIQSGALLPPDTSSQLKINL